MAIPDDRNERRWLKPWQAAVAFLVLGLGAQLAALVVAVIGIAADTAIRKASGAPSSLPTSMPQWALALAVLASAIVLVAGSMLVAKLARVPIRHALGFRSPPPLAYGAACLAAIAASPVGGVLVLSARKLAPGLTLGTMEATNQHVASTPLWLAIPVFALLPGIAEETFFRGLLQRSIRTPAVAIVLSAVLFAAFHVDPHHAAGTLPLGFVLAWVAARTGSTLVPMAAHASFNLLAIVLQRFVDEKTDTAELSGASFGVAAGGAALALAFCWLLSRLMRDHERSRELQDATGPARS